jgi:hypothetical protein
MGTAAARIGGTAGEHLRAEAHALALAMVAALITLVRGRAIDDHEQTVLAACLHELYDASFGPPVLLDLVRVLALGPERVRAVTLDRGSEHRYRATVDPLHRSLLDGPLGSVFGSATTARIDLSAPAVGGYPPHWGGRCRADRGGDACCLVGGAGLCCHCACAR